MIVFIEGFTANSLLSQVNSLAATHNTGTIAVDLDRIIDHRITKGRIDVFRELLKGLLGVTSNKKLLDNVDHVCYNGNITHMDIPSGDLRYIDVLVNPLTVELNNDILTIDVINFKIKLFPLRVKGIL